MAISSIIPDAQEFIKMSPEDRAWVLITEAGGTSAKSLNIHNLLLPNSGHVLDGYPAEGHSAITAAYFGAWQWLQPTGYLRPDGSMDFLQISPQGTDWYLEHPLTTSRQIRDFLKGTSLPFARGRGITLQVAALLGHAMVIGEHFTPDVEGTVKSLVLAFLVASDPVSRWFQGFVNRNSVDIDLILKSATISREDLGKTSSRDDAAMALLVARSKNISRSWLAEDVFEEAANLAKRTSPDDTPLDVRHVMGALIYRPGRNMRELEGWGFRRRDWSSAFLIWLLSDYRGEVTQWTTIHIEVFGDSPSLPSEMRSNGEPAPQADGRPNPPKAEGKNSWRASSIAHLLALRLTAVFGNQPPYQAMACLISPSLAVTAYHVIADSGLSRGPYSGIGIEFLGTFGFKTAATVAAGDESKDFAILRLEPEAFFGLPLDPFPADVSLEVSPNQSWESYWVSGSAPQGMRVAGTVAGYVNDAGGARYFQLHMELPTTDVKGASGAPVVVGDRLVGIIIARDTNNSSVLLGLPLQEIVKSKHSDEIRSLIPSYPTKRESADGGKLLDGESPPDINHFSEQVLGILAHADQIRKQRKMDRVHTEHVVLAIHSQGRPSQIVDLADAAGVNLSNIIERDSGISSEQPIKIPGLPPISRNVYGALIRARDKADADKSSSIDENHLLFGVLSQGNSPVVQELNTLGMTPDKVKFSAQLSQGEPKPAPIPPDAREPEEAASAHIATDSWTIDDKLGHFAYAHALYRFITHEKTEAPLAISIQAPWGGGKTSLMRMVQNELDPEAVEKLEHQRKERSERNRTIPKMISPGRLKEELGANAIRIIDVIKEIANWKKPTADASVTNPSVPYAAPESSKSSTGAPGPKHRITVWFNAWKYQSTEQVWAGLADCILRQVTDRMGVLERQRFWLQLQMSRLDADRIQRRIFEKIAAEWWRLARPWTWGTIGLILALSEAVLAGNKWLQGIGVSGSLLTAIVGGAKLLRLYTATKSKVEQEPAELSLREYLQVPDYRGKVGFIHEVAEDLNRVMNAIQPKDLPIVVFIDDLDRCSPQKVAEVIEGINLFLAGEFPDCVFIFGMDAEMVAAALERAHSEVIAKLPSYAISTPVGWRFMDKFIQLPFVIPPPERTDLNHYVESLFEEEAEKKPIPRDVQAKIENVVRSLKPNGVSEVVRDVSDLAKEYKLTPIQQKEVSYRLERVQKIAEIDAEINRASSDSEVLRNFVSRVSPDLFSNPRDLKRFLNTFRLYDFLRIARERRNLQAPSRELIARWIVLSLKWPQVVRWMHRMPGDGASGPVKKDETASLGFRLRQFEVFAAEVRNHQGVENWTRLLASGLGAEVKNLDWVSDRTLFEFFQEMGRGREDGRLSHGAGKGLW